MRIPRICLLLALVLAVASLVYGQGVATGDLHVTVKDPQGNLVTNATVTVRDEAKGIERPAASNGTGEYSAQALPPASYVVTVSASGFAPATATGVVITVRSWSKRPALRPPTLSINFELITYRLTGEITSISR